MELALLDATWPCLSERARRCGGLDGVTTKTRELKMKSFSFSVLLFGSCAGRRRRRLDERSLLRHFSLIQTLSSQGLGWFPCDDMTALSGCDQTHSRSTTFSFVVGCPAMAVNG